MSQGSPAVRRGEVEGFTVSIERAEGGFEYEIQDCAKGISMEEVAEALFSVALDIRAAEQARSQLVG